MKVLTAVDDRTAVLDVLTTTRDASGSRVLEISKDYHHRLSDGRTIVQTFVVQYLLRVESDAEDRKVIHLYPKSIHCPSNSITQAVKFFSVVKKKIEKMAGRLGHSVTVNLANYSRRLEYNKGVILLTR